MTRAMGASNPNADLRNHGIAVRRGVSMAWRIVPHPRDGQDRVYLGYNTGGAYLVVACDPRNGRCVQYDAEAGCHGPWGMTATPEGQLLVSGADGSISELDPLARTLRVVGRASTWFWNICRGTDGRYYLGGKTPAALFRFDHRTGALDNLGVVDPGNQLVRRLEADEAGFIYMITGAAASRAYAYDIARERTTALLPTHEAESGFHTLGHGRDGHLYIRCTGGHVYRLEHGRALRVAPARFPGFADPQLSDGTPVSLVDPDGIRVGTGRRSRVLPVSYTAPGAGIFHVARGPDDTVYGSTILPLYLFRYTPARRKLENLGRGGLDTGEIYAFAQTGGKLYYSTYAGGRLMVFDPKRPIRLGASESNGWGTRVKVLKPWNGNPKWLGDLGQGHCRTQAMHVDARDRVWVGSEAEYGKRHGGLACYDTRRKALSNNPVVIRDQGINSLTSGPDADMLYGGSTIVRGSTMDPVTREAHVFAWDVAKRRVAWRVVPVEGTTGVNNLHWVDGLLYGTGVGNYTFFVLDPVTRKAVVVHPSAWGGARPESICRGPDGALYGLTWCCLFRWEAGKAPTVVMRCTGRVAAGFPGGSLFHRGAVIVGNRYYFSCGPQVMSMRLPAAYCRPGVPGNRRPRT